MTATTSSMNQGAIYVYEAPVRLWHWIMTLAIVVLMLTGYFIGQPLPTLSGEASDHYLMGYIRFTHFTAAYVLIIGFVFRVYWVFVGNPHARQIFLPPIFNGAWWKDVFYEIRWYTFLVKEPKKYLGHNPLATLFMHLMLVWGTVFMIFTGLALYGEGEGMGSWQYRWFSSWVIPLLGNSQDTHMFHRLGMWYILCFVIIHCYLVIREDIMTRQSIVGAMISGYRMFKDGRAPDERT